MRWGIKFGWMADVGWSMIVAEMKFLFVHVVEVTYCIHIIICLSSIKALFLSLIDYYLLWLYFILFYPPFRIPSTYSAPFVTILLISTIASPSWSAKDNIYIVKHVAINIFFVNKKTYALSVDAGLSRENPNNFVILIR